MIKKAILSFFIISLCCKHVSAQTINVAKMDSLFSAIEVNNQGMGSFAIAKKGVIVYEKSIGNSTIKGDKQIKATAHTKYRIGSISKMFTATMIFQLVEEKKLSLSTTLDKYFPTIPNAGKITIGNLLNMASGIHNLTSDSAYKSWMIRPKTEDEIIKIMAADKPDFEPGTIQVYSNSNFILLGYILEKVSGKPYKELLKERVTTKIGLAETYYGGKIGAKDNESFSYTWADNWTLSPETDMSIPGGAGAVVSTPADLVKFITALFTGKLISKESLDQMKNIPARKTYGMGMVPYHFGSKTGYGHNGAIDGFKASLAYFPDDSLAVCYCANGEVYGVNDILIGAVSIYFNESYAIPSFKAVVLDSNEIAQYPGVYSSSSFPLKIRITQEKTTLTAQATGQPSFPLKAEDHNRFTYSPAGIELSFDPGKNEMTLIQKGRTIIFTREK